MTTNSALYVGKVIHRRLWPQRHYLRYAAFWFLLDLDEIDELNSELWLFSRNRFNAMSFSTPTTVSKLKSNCVRRSNVTLARPASR